MTDFLLARNAQESGVVTTFNICFYSLINHFQEEKTKEYSRETIKRLTEMDTSVYSHALEVWSKADLSSLQKDLDSNVLEVKDKEAKSLDSRKSLANETKLFKKLEADEKLNQVNKIIKQYQKEIDSLTQRAKFSEQFLFDIYAKISEAPDPKPLLENSIDKLDKVDDSKELKEKISLLEDNIAKYADYESLKSRLLDLEQNSAVTLSKRLTAKEQELNSVWEEKQRNWKIKEEDLSKQLESLQANNKALETKISKQIDIGEASKPTETENMDNSDNKPEGFTSFVEYNLLSQEFESAQSRILQLEKRNEELSGALAKATSAAEQESQLQYKEMKINQLQSENALLSASLDRESNNNKKEQTHLQEKLSNTEIEAKAYKSELDKLRMKFKNYSDYTQIKTELAALKKIEFGADEDDESQNNNISSSGEKFDNTLLAANKKLQATLADLRVRNSQESEKNYKFEQQIKEMKGKIEELQRQNTKLELDLEKVDDIDQKFNDAASMMSGVTRQINNRGGNHTGKLSPTSSIVGIPEESEIGTMNNNNNSTILPIVTKQRDRFRSRNTDLERQLRKSDSENSKLKMEMNKLKNDNGRLYEKIRYLSSYRGTTERDNSILHDVDSEAQYQNSYEESLHPLASFKKKESAYYKNNRLSVLEKLFVSFANIVLQNKTSRMVFLFYCIGLHGLVFMMSMYVINISGYMTPEVGIVQTQTGAPTVGNAGINGIKAIAEQR